MTTPERIMSTGIKKVWLEHINQARSLAPPGDRALQECLGRLYDEIASDEYVVGLAGVFHTEDSLANKMQIVELLREAANSLRTYQKYLWQKRANPDKLDEIRDKIKAIEDELLSPTYIMAIDPNRKGER